MLWQSWESHPRNINDLNAELSNSGSTDKKNSETSVATGPPKRLSANRKTGAVLWFLSYQSLAARNNPVIRTMSVNVGFNARSHIQCH
jgi:hypothetical protein